MKTGAKSDHVRGALSVVVLSITIQLWNINLFVTRSIERIEFMTYFLYLSLTYLSHKGVLATKHPWLGSMDLLKISTLQLPVTSHNIISR